MNQLYFLDCCRYRIQPDSLINKNAEASICQAKGLIDDQNNLSERALSILDELDTYIVKTKKKVAASVLGEDFMGKIKEYREIFPPKRLPSGELARQTVNELKDKFIWFFKTYPEFNWELVLDATDYYVARYAKTDYLYMQTSSYFIKKKNQDNTFTSKLADTCQQLLDNPNIVNELNES
jgi:hypothetical protein